MSKDTHETPNPAEAPSATQGDEAALHGVFGHIFRAQALLLGDVPRPPTVIDLALAVNALIAAVTALAARALDPAAAPPRAVAAPGEGGER